MAIKMYDCRHGLWNSHFTGSHKPGQDHATDAYTLNLYVNKCT